MPSIRAPSVSIYFKFALYFKSQAVLRKRIAVKISFFLNGFIYANWISRLPLIQEQFDADNGTIGTDYVAAATITAITSAATMTAAKIGNEAGTAISA